MAAFSVLYHTGTAKVMHPDPAVEKIYTTKQGGTGFIGTPCEAK